MERLGLGYETPACSSASAHHLLRQLRAGAVRPLRDLKAGAGPARAGGRRSATSTGTRTIRLGRRRRNRRLHRRPGTSTASSARPRLPGRVIVSSAPTSTSKPDPELPQHPVASVLPSMVLALVAGTCSRSDIPGAYLGVRWAWALPDRRRLHRHRDEPHQQARRARRRRRSRGGAPSRKSWRGDKVRADFQEGFLR